MVKVKESGIVKQFRKATADMTAKTVRYCRQVKAGQFIAAVAIFTTVIVLWLLIAPSAKFDIDSEEETYETVQTISPDVTRDVRQPHCEIFSVDKTQIDVAVGAGGLMCFPREAGTFVTDLPTGQSILRKTNTNFCVKCCFAHVFFENKELKRSTCYAFSTVRSLSSDRMPMVQTTCKDFCGYDNTNRANLKSEKTLALHALFTIPERIRNKMNYWDKLVADVKEINPQRKTKTDSKILKIILVNIDNLSRQDVRQILPATMKRILDFGFIEMKGFSRISAEPATNLLASLTGLKPRKWDPVCSFSKTGSFDKCPFIWKRLSALRYITSYVQDASIFSTAKIRNDQHQDFYRSPVDYFLEHNLYKSMLTDSSEDCKNSLSIRTLLEFSERIIQKFSKYPLFSMTRITNSNHNSSELDLDYKLELFFQNIENTLEDSVVAFYSNQGYGFSSANLRKQPGSLNRFEPFLFLRVPQKYEYQGFKGNLELNRDRLTTMYDFYKTLEHVGRMTCMAVQSKEKNESECFKTREKTGKLGSSLFLPISPYRNCSDAKIPEEVCSCNVNPSLFSDKYAQSSKFLKKVGGIVLGKLNGLIPNSGLCSTFVLKWVDEVTLIRDTLGKNQLDFLVRFRVGVLDNINLEMAMEQRVRTGRDYARVMAIGLPIWASKKAGNGPKCLHSASRNFLDKSFCVCKSSSKKR